MIGPTPRMVLHVLNGPSGGAALSAISLMTALSAEGIEASAICHDAGTPHEREALREATHGRVVFSPLYWWNRKIRTRPWKRPLIEAAQLVRTGATCVSTLRVAQCARRYQADLVHTNTLTTPEGGKTARLLRLPHVWHVRELVGKGHPFRLWREGQALGRYLARHASVVVANSQASATGIRPYVPSDALEVVPNGVDLSHFRLRETRRSGAPVVVGMVGNLTSRVKKHLLFVEAASRVDRRLDVSFRIYGHRAPKGDAYEREIETCISRHGLAERVRLAGHYPEPSAIMEEVDVLVHPADGESFGRVVVEAMAAGIPVVGARGGGVAEIVVDGVTGLLAAPENADDLARDIARLVASPDLRRDLGSKGRKRAEACYSLTACKDAMLAVYQKAMDRPITRFNWSFA